MTNEQFEIARYVVAGFAVAITVWQALKGAKERFETVSLVFLFGLTLAGLFVTFLMSGLWFWLIDSSSGYEKLLGLILFMGGIPILGGILSVLAVAIVFSSFKNPSNLAAGLLIAMLFGGIFWGMVKETEKREISRTNPKPTVEKRQKQNNIIISDDVMSGMEWALENGNEDPRKCDFGGQAFRQGCWKQTDRNQRFR